MSRKESIDDDLGDRSSSPETSSILNCVLNAPFSFTSIIGNTLVLAAILRSSSLHSPSTNLLYSLAVQEDVSVGLVVQLLYIAYQLTEKGLLQLPGKAASFLALGVSLSTMTVISLDGFLALHFHMQYPNMMTVQRHISAALWLSAFLLSRLSFWDRIAYYTQWQLLASPFVYFSPLIVTSRSIGL